MFLFSGTLTPAVNFQTINFKGSYSERIISKPVSNVADFGTNVGIELRNQLPRVKITIIRDSLTAIVTAPVLTPAVNRQPGFRRGDLV